MLGVDVERILGTLNILKDETSKYIALLSSISDFRMETINHTHNVRVVSSDGSHNHGSGAHNHDFWLQGNNPTNGNGLVNHVSDQLTYTTEYTDDLHPDHPHILDSIIYERENPYLMPDFIGTIAGLAELLVEDKGKMENIDKKMYINKSTFNNSYGSPWQEIYILVEKIDYMITYSKRHSTLQWMGEKFTLIALMQIILSYTIDAKWALLHYQDYIQRGYDSQFNNNRPSITRDDFMKGASIGNRDQSFGENVNVERKSNDPF